VDDNIEISNKLIFCKDRNEVFNLRKYDTQDLVPKFSSTYNLKFYYFNRIANEWNGLPHQITVVNQKVLQG